MSLNNPAARRRLYALVGVAVFAAGIAVALLKPRFDLIVSDGRFYYVYLPTIAIDGDLDFSNQIRDHWPQSEHPALGIDVTAKGLDDNHYPVGLALTLSPAFAVAHGLAHAGHALTGLAFFRPDGYAPVYHVVCFAWLACLLVASLCLLDHLLADRLGYTGPVALAAVLTTLVGTPWLYYAFREPFMAHGAGVFWMTLAVALTAKALDDVSHGRLVFGTGWMLVFATTMVVLCRQTNVVLAPFGLWLLARIVGAGLLPRLLFLLPGLATAVAPVLAQLLVWHGLHGRWYVYSYNSHGFHWADPALWQTLFSSRHGLFFWSPAALLSLAGVVMHLSRPSRVPSLAWCYLAAFALLWYVNSAWEQWWFGDSFGLRAFVELSGLFAIGFAALYARLAEASVGVRRPALAAVGVGVVVNLALMVAYIARLVPRDGYLIAGF